MSLTRLSANSDLNLSTWGQLTKVSSATPSTALPLAAAPGSTITLSSLTSSGTTATATAPAAHGLNTGDKVTIAGASLANYNGTFAITVTGATTFTYVMAGTATSPAVRAAQASLLLFCDGSPTGGLAISSITQSGNVATVTVATAPLNPFVAGDAFNITGASNSEYNGVDQIVSVTSALIFTYAVANNPTSPATARASFLTYTVPQIKASRMLINAASANTAAVGFGPDSTASFATIPAGTGYLMECPPDKQHDLSAWYFKSTDASQTIVIAYI